MFIRHESIREQHTLRNNHHWTVAYLTKCLPSRQQTLNQCCFNVGPTSSTLTQHQANIWCLVGGIIGLTSPSIIVDIPADCVSNYRHCTNVHVVKVYSQIFWPGIELIIAVDRVLLTWSNNMHTVNSIKHHV